MHMRLAFKAQSQARAAIETLAEIKNPHQFAFVKQANIAGGNQQVNNRGAAADSSMTSDSSEHAQNSGTEYSQRRSRVPIKPAMANPGNLASIGPSPRPNMPQL